MFLEWRKIFSVTQLANEGNWLLFSFKDVKMYKELIVIGTPTTEAKRMDFVYVMLAESAYVDKAWKNETTDL